MLKFDRVVALSAAFAASIFCAGGSMLFALEGVSVKDVVLSSLDKHINSGLMKTPFDGDFDKVKSFCASFVGGLYKDLSDGAWWEYRKGDCHESYFDFESDVFRCCFSYSPTNLCRFIDEDTRVLTDFLVSRVFPSGKSDEYLKMLMVRDSITVRKVIARAFTEKEISLRGLSALLSSEFFQEAVYHKDRVATCVKTIIEKGDFFCGKFADVFWRFFVEKNDYHFRDAFVLLKFFGGHFPSHPLEMNWGLKAFESVKKRKKFQTFSERELREFSSRITCALQKRNTMLHTILLTVPPENVEKTEDFFYRTTKVIKDVKGDADSLLNEYNKFSDSRYWKVSTHFNDEEAKKIFDELEGKEEKTVEYNH